MQNIVTTVVPAVSVNCKNMPKICAYEGFRIQGLTSKKYYLKNSRNVKKVCIFHCSFIEPVFINAEMPATTLFLHEQDRDAHVNSLAWIFSREEEVSLLLLYRILLLETSFLRWLPRRPARCLIHPAFFAKSINKAINCDRISQ